MNLFLAKYKKKCLFLILWLMILSLTSLSAQAEVSLSPITKEALLHQKQQIEQQLDEEQQHFILLQKSTDHLIKQKKAEWQLLLMRGITKQDLNNARLSLANAESTANNILIALSTLKVELNKTLEMQEYFNQEHFQSIAESSLDQVKQLFEQRELLQSIALLQKNYMDLLISEQKIADNHVLVMRRWYQQIEQFYDFHFKQNTQLDLTLSSSKIQAQTKFLTSELNEYAKQLMNVKPDSVEGQQKQGQIEFNMFIIRERLAVNQIALFLLKSQNYFQPNLIIESEQITLLQLQQKLSEINQNSNQINTIINQIKDKLVFIANQKKALSIVAPASEINYDLQKLNEIYQAFQAQLVIANNFQRDLMEHYLELEKIKNSRLSMRQTLPAWSWTAWYDLVTQLFKVPIYMWHSLKDTAVELIFNLKTYPGWDIYGPVILALLIGFWVLLRKTFLKMLEILEDRSEQFSGKFLAVILQLVRKNLGTLLLLSTLFLAKINLNLDIGLWISIVLIFLIFKLVTILARIWLLESEEHVNGTDVQLYHGLKWIFWMTGIFSMIMVFTYVFPVGYEVRVLCNKILMLLLLALSILLFRSWSVLPILIQKAFAVRRAYVIRAIQLVCKVFPITFFTNAIIGLIGYVQLAFVMGEYQIIALLTLTTYMIMRGLLTDFFDFNYHLIVNNFRSGWLWIQVFGRPLEHTLRICLFIGAFFMFYHWSSLNQNVQFTHYWDELMKMTLINLYGNIITVPILIESIIIIAVVYWFAKWSREFAFRWLYARAKDIGLRNSLSIFTQYAVVLIGVIVALRVLGFDLTGFAVVFAAFAAGIGFGLRDVATNFISGILLLLERPFRAGDSITLGEYEGEVISTGMRSMKIRTWDRMELIVPNADMFTKPFINWTHQDSIVRSVIKLRIKRMDDPHFVQDLILKLFEQIPSVVTDPLPEVFMKELSEALIEFEIRYYVNLQVQNSRPRVRSEVLFAIWDCFKKHGIQDPEHEYHVRIFKEEEKNTFLKEKVAVEV